MNIKGKRPVRSQVAVGGINRGTRPVRPSRPIPTRQPRRDDRMRRNHGRPTPPPHHRDHHHYDHHHHRPSRRKGSCFGTIAALIVMLVLVFLVVYKDEVKEKLFPQDTVTSEESATTGNASGAVIINPSSEFTLTYFNPKDGLDYYNRQ